VHTASGQSFVLAQCDRPAIFYMNRDRLQMQYLNVPAASLTSLDSLSLIKDLQVFISVNNEGHLQFGSADDLE
jgi:hypothetical protein